MVSRSYGPGRYDPAYEVRGVDYPLPYVRWTERRNMLAFLELVARGDVNLEPLITHRYPIEEAETAYEVVTGTRKEPAVAIVLRYDGAEAQPSQSALLRAAEISNEARRTQAVIQIAQAWYKLHPGPATAWLEQSELDDEQRGRVVASTGKNVRGKRKKGHNKDNKLSGLIRQR